MKDQPPPQHPKQFLAAEWRNLLMANYLVDPNWLQPYVPAKTTLDAYDGNTYVSLVGFMFKKVRVKGISIPFHINFPEVNLRFYVRYREGETWKRGVVFIKEIVPKPAITWIANTLFKEHYATMPMKVHELAEDNQLQVNYQWKYKGQWHGIGATTAASPVPILPGSAEEFITEHFWGYSASGPFASVEYQVAHPRWNIYPLRDYTLHCDFDALYGGPFGALNHLSPHSFFWAQGSAVEVYNKKII